MAEEEDECILYELLVHNEWLGHQKTKGQKKDGEARQPIYQHLLAAPRNMASYAWNAAKEMLEFRNVSQLSESGNLLSNTADWQLGVGAHGAVIAILQDASLEIRTKKDQYLSVVGKNFGLIHDPFPSWRKICWSPECSMVAVGFSNGVVEIYNTVGATLFTVYPPRFKERGAHRDSSQSLVGLFFSTVRTKNMTWTAELILVDFKGLVNSYFVSPTEGYQESGSFSFRHLYPDGITAITELGSMFLVAGSTKYGNDAKLRNNGLGHGLSLWRMLDEYPFYKQVPTIDEDEYIFPDPGLLHRWLKDKPVQDYIFRLCASPSGKQVAAVHASGSVSVWDVPSLRKRRFWLLEDQPNFDAVNTLQLGRGLACPAHPETIKNHLVNVKWWNESAIILARMSGAVTICSIFSLKNLLGASPEFFDGVPQITEVNDRGFLVLEMELRPPTEEVLDEEHTKVESKTTQAVTAVYNFVLHWTIGTEEPAAEVSLPTMDTRTFRLLSLKSTTPQELYLRKIELEEFGEALALAQRYRLDCDLVYQRQWRNNPVTVVSIQDYLTKIKRRSWVVEECLTRIPQDFEATRELLLYGLRGTELDTLVAIGRGIKTDEFIFSELSVEYEEDLDEDPEEAEKRAEEWSADDLRKRTELLSHIDFRNLSPEQIEVIKARQSLLKFFDRLGTYEILHGLGEFDSDKFDHDFYKGIRHLTALEACVKFAHTGNAAGVEVLFTYHGDETLPHRLAILSHLPPMVGPYEYRSLLPECDLSGQVFEWEEERYRDPDWCEDDICRKATGTYEEDGGAHLYTDHPYLLLFKGQPLTDDLVRSWYLLRAREVEQSAHFVDVALDLVKLGRERNVLGLDKLQAMLDSLEILTYEVGLPSLTLDQFENLDNLQRLKLFMSTSTSETVIQNLWKWGLPFLQYCEKMCPGSKSTLIKQYVVAASKEDLSFTLKAIQHSQAASEECIFTSPEDILNVAIDSITQCDKTNQLPRAFAILENLPLKDTKTGSAYLLDLHDQVDMLEDQLVTAEILSNHQILVTPSQLKQMQGDKQASIQLYTRLARSLTRREKTMKLKDWKKLLEDCLEMQQKVFFQVDPSDCYEIITDALLTSGVREYIDSAREFLETVYDESSVQNGSSRRVPFDKVVQLVLSAAREYFNSSDSYDNESIQLARYCLRIIESDNTEILQELDLISSLTILPDVGVHKLPMQVRMCKDRLSLIKEALSASTQNYLQGSRLLHLSKLIRVCGNNERSREAKVLSLIVESALKVGDYSSASVWCDQLVTDNHSESWPICATLGQCEQCPDLKFRAKLIDFALTHSDTDHIEQLLRSRHEIDLRLLYIEARVQMQPPEQSLGSEDEFEDAKSIQAEESFDEYLDLEEASVSMPLRRFLGGSLGVTKGLISATAFTTSKLTSSVTSRKFWKAASGWIQPISEAAAKLTNPDTNTTENKSPLEVPKVHAFYKDLWPEADISSLGASYTSYALPLVNSSATNFSFHLLRIALIEQTLSEDTCGTKIDSQVVEELGKLLLAEDICLGLSFLLTVPSQAEVQNIFASLPQTELCLQLSMYYNSMQIYLHTNPWDQPTQHPLYYSDPYEIISQVSTWLSEGVHTISVPQDSVWCDSFLNNQKLLSQLVEGQSLQHLGAVVNIKRFLVDPDYKMDTVLGLAMTSDKEVFQYALDLAKKYGVPQWQVFATHLQHMFDSEAVADIEASIAENTMTPVLRDNFEQFAQFMLKNILFTISGRDYRRLKLFYGLIEQHSDKSAVFIEILDYLVASENLLALDFKILIEPDADLPKHLNQILNAQNIDIFAQVARLFDKCHLRALTSGLAYYTLARKTFYDYASAQKPKMKREWLTRYEDCTKYMDMMSSDQITDLLQYFTLSKQAQEIPLEVRVQMLNVASKQCIELSQKNDEGTVFEEAASRLQKMSDHIKSLNSNSFKQLLMADKPLSTYAMEFQLSGGEECVLNELSHTILRQGSSLAVLREILALYPEDLMPMAEDVLTSVFHATMEQLQTEASESTLGVIDNLFRQFQQYFADCGELIDEDDILDEIREFMSVPDHPLQNRIGVLALATKYLNTTADDHRQLQALQTGGILEKAFDKVEDSSSPDSDTPDVHTAQGRKDLFNKLYAALSSFEQAQSLYDLLQIWPRFESDFYANASTNPWQMIIMKTLETEIVQDSLLLITTIAKHASENDQLPGDCERTIVNALLKRECLKEAAKLAFRSGDSSSVNVVVEAYKTHTFTEKSYDEELLQLIIDQRFVVRLLATPLYGPLVLHLIEMDEATVLADVADCLRQKNKFVEAASLQLQLSHIPTSLKTVSVALLKSIGKLV